MKLNTAKLLAALAAVMIMFGSESFISSETGYESDFFVSSALAQAPAPAAPPAAAPAAESAAGEPAGPPSTLGDYWGIMGVTKWPMLGAAIWITSIVIELILRGRVKALCPPEAVSQLSSTLAVKDYVKAWQYCIDNPSALSRVIAPAIEKIPQGAGAAMDVAMDQLNYQNSIFRSKNSYLNLNATGDTLLGLFGTISGMINAFNKMAYSGATGDPAKLAGSIGEALINTWVGLGLAILSLGLFYIFTNRIKIAITGMQNIVTKLIEQIDFSSVTPDMEIITAEMKARAVGGKGAAAAPGPAPVKTASRAAAKPAEMVQCPHCQHQVQVGAAKCPKCNSELEWE
jgi:biopolymer transport protein ExbB